MVKAIFTWQQKEQNHEVNCLLAGDLLRDHSEVCTSSVCFYITLWALLHDPFLLLSFFNIQISILFFFFILA